MHVTRKDSTGTNEDLIYLNDNIKYLLYLDSDIKLTHRLIRLHIYYTGNDIMFEFKNEYSHDQEIHDFCYDNSKSHTGIQYENIYFSDILGNIFKLKWDSFRKVEDIRKDKKEQTQGFLAIDDEDVYFSELGETHILKIDKDTDQLVYIDVNLMSHKLESLNDFLILADLNNIYIVEKETYQVIANYKIKGELTALCQRAKDDHFFGITNQG